VEDLIEQRKAAKAAKNWAEADRVRDELKAQGIVLEDRKDGTVTWRRG
jgi:cysteinyl-tRNA synthetase